jgi:hypothetical protein
VGLTVDVEEVEGEERGRGIEVKGLGGREASKAEVEAFRVTGKGEEAGRAQNAEVVHEVSKEEAGKGTLIPRELVDTLKRSIEESRGGGGNRDKPNPDEVQKEEKEGRMDEEVGGGRRA